MSEPTMHERAIAAALEELERNAQVEAQSDLVTEPAERAFYTRWANAYRKALYYHLTGIRATAAGGGDYLVPSQRGGGVIWRVQKHGGCTCEAARADRACWHAALTLGYEIALDIVDRDDDAPAMTDEDKTRAYAEMDELFAA